MMQEINQTEQEKFDMYMKLSKEELAMLLIESNRNLFRVMQPRIEVVDSEKINPLISPIWCADINYIHKID